MVRVADPGQIQSVRGANGPTCRAVTGLKRILDVVRAPSPGADTLQRADKAAYLIVEKGPCPHVEMYFPSVDTIDTGDIQPIQRLQGAVGLTDGRAKGGEIVPSNQVIRPGLHGVRVKVVVHPPDQTAKMRGRGAAHQDAK